MFSITAAVEKASAVAAAEVAAKERSLWRSNATERTY
jgi:hypothetical protein